MGRGWRPSTTPAFTPDSGAGHERAVEIASRIMGADFAA